MSMSTKFRQLLKDEHGVTAVLVAVSLTATLGMTSAAVDVGMLYVAKAELQNAADAAALAAADTMISYDANGSGTAATGTALSTARTISGDNSVIGVSVPLKDPAGGDFTIGYWDPATRNFDSNHTGMGIVDTNYLTGVRVTIRRDSQANDPVPTFFAGIVGLSAVGLSATSTAFLGWPSNAPAGAVDLPIAVISTAIVNNGQPNCGTSLTFHSQNDQNSEWTTFFTTPANNPTVDEFVTGALQIPALKVGDQIDMINGNLSNNTFADLVTRFNNNAVNGVWTVQLPVIGTVGMGSNLGTIVGFMSFSITEVRGAPHKDITGTLACQMVMPNSASGGGNYGTRATASNLVR